MEAPEGPPRFECPADFSPCLFAPGPAFSQETLQSPSKQLWLIRAPANFSPESLDGHTVPLLGSQMLTVPGMEKVYNCQAVPGDLDSAHLLMPSSRQDHLTCAPSFSGMLSICERVGDPCSNQPLLPVAARLVPQIPAGLRQRFLPFGGHPQGRHSGQEAAEEPPRKKKKRKLHTVGYMEASEESLPGPGEASVVPAGAWQEGEGSQRRKRKHQEVLLPLVIDTAQQSQSENGSQLSSSLEGTTHESLSSGGGTGSRKKRKKEPQLKEELNSFPQEPALQVACAADGCGPEAEGLLPYKPKKKKKKKRQQEDEAAALALVDIPSMKQEAMEGQGGPEATLEGSLGESLPRGRHKKMKKEKVVADEAPWEQGAGAVWLGLNPVKLEGARLPGEEMRQHKKKKHKHAAAVEES